MEDEAVQPNDHDLFHDGQWPCFCSLYFYQHGLRPGRAEQGNEKGHASPVASMCWLLAPKAAVFSFQCPVGHSSASTQGGWIAGLQGVDALNVKEAWELLDTGAFLTVAKPSSTQVAVGACVWAAEWS